MKFKVDLQNNELQMCDLLEGDVAVILAGPTTPTTSVGNVVVALSDNRAGHWEEIPEGSTADVFDLSDEGLYFTVTYGENAYAFKESYEAYKFMNVFVGYKADALLERYGSTDE